MITIFNGKNRKETMNKGILGATFLTIAAFFWGTTFVAQKIAGGYQGVFTFCSLRNILAAIALSPVVSIYEKKNLSKTDGQEDRKKDNKQIMTGGIITGIFLAGTAVFQQMGIQMGTGAGKAGFLTSFYIVLVPVIGIFFGKKCRKQVWFSVILAIIGIYFLCVNERLTILPQDVFVLLCSIACALQITAVDYYAPKVSNPIHLAQIEFLVCGIITAIPMIIFEIGFTKETVLIWGQTLNGINDWIPLLYATIFSSVVAYTLQIVAQKDMNAAVASLIMSLESVFAVLASVIILGEKMTIKELFGCVIVFVAVIMSQLFQENMNN